MELLKRIFGLDLNYFFNYLKAFTQYQCDDDWDDCCRR